MERLKPFADHTSVITYIRLRVAFLLHKSRMTVLLVELVVAMLMKHTCAKQQQHHIHSDEV